MKYKILSLAAAAFLVLSSVAAQAQGLDFKNYSQALKEAEEGKKTIMVFFWANWCRYCIQLREEVFKNSRVKAAFDKAFVAVSVNVEDDQDDLSKKYRASNALPTITFVGADEEPLGYFDGAVDADTFVQILDHVKAGL